MWFLIGIIIFILFCLIVYFYFKCKVNGFMNKFGLSSADIGNIVKEVRLEDMDTPKSLSSMDSIYLEQIKKDFPDLNINELKRESEKVLLDCFNAINNNDISKLSGKIKSFAETMINDNINVRFENIKIHNTVVSNYSKDRGIATIYFGSSFEYYRKENGERVKTQDRVKTEFIYIIDKEKVDTEVNALGIHCPNCGSPITSLGEKKCSYCGSAVLEIIGKVFSCNDIVRY